jgi:hypothetical protein
MPMTLPYRLISRADILADDARLARKYPGQWQRTPGSLEYAAVSAVGFNAARTKALVYMRLRMSGDLLRMELKEGRWVAAQGPHAGGARKVRLPDDKSHRVGSSAPYAARASATDGNPVHLAHRSMRESEGRSVVTPG